MQYNFIVTVTCFDPKALSSNYSTSTCLFNLFTWNIQ